MTNYKLKFIKLLAPLENVSEELTLEQFLNELWKDMMAKVRLRGPLIVDHAIELTHMIEDKPKFKIKGI